MGSDGPSKRFLAWLDSDLARTYAASDEVVLAFSGGLGSQILAALARKRGDVRCVVVGTQGSSDVEAALVASKFLDYPVEVVRPSPRKILSVARGIGVSDPGLPLPEILSLVPLALVEDRHPGGVLLSGFALSPRSRALQRHLVADRVRVPGLRRTGPLAPSRRLALHIAGSLGIPDAFAFASRRTPAEGSGVGPALRALGHARHASVGRLVDVVI